MEWDSLLVHLQNLYDVCLECTPSVIQPPKDPNSIDVKLTSLCASGDVSAIIQLFKTDTSSVLDEQVYFKLYLHEFKEIASSESKETQKQMIEYIQQKLSSSAMTAYPSAYVELRDALMKVALTPSRGQESRQQKMSELESSRNALCSFLLSRIKKSTGPSHFPPQLILTLRYLCLVQNMYYFLQGGSSPVSLITDRFVLPPAANDATSSLAGMSSEEIDSANVNEDDVAKLAQAAGITRNEARISLSQVHLIDGSPFSQLEFAMRNQMANLRSDVEFLTSVFHEYLHWRDTLQLPSISSIDQIPTFIADTIIPLILDQDPDFPNTQGLFYFALRRLQMLGTMVQAKQSDRARAKTLWEKAASILRNDLAPYTKTHPNLLPTLKELSLLLALKYPELDACSHPESISDRARQLLDVVNGIVQNQLAYYLLTKTGLPIPKILEGLNYLLSVHAKWFKMQCEEDKFENIFGIPSLRLDPILRDFLLSTNVEGMAMAMAIDSPQQPSSFTGIGPGVSGDHVNSNSTTSIDQSSPSSRRYSGPRPGEVVIEESSIELMMDILACSREEALEFLRERNGNIQEALSVLYG